MPKRNGLGPRRADVVDEKSVPDIALLRLGRRFRPATGAKGVVGRNEGENDRLIATAVVSDVLLDVVGFTGSVRALRR